MQYKYQQIKQYLARLIASNPSSTNRLPSEKELTLKFKVSRIAATQALNELEAEGLIVRIKGKGNFPVAQSAVINSDSKICAFLMPDLKSHFTADIIASAESILRANGYDLLLSLTEYSQEVEKQQLQRALDHNCCGLLIYPVDNPVYNTDILKLVLGGFPVVFIDRTLPGIDINCVSSDHETEMRNATEHLIQKGHKKIGVITTGAYWTTNSTQRLTSYENTLHRHNIPFERRLIYSIDTYYDKNAPLLVQSFIEKNPDITALITVGSNLGYTVYKTLLHIGKRCPEDISMVIFDEEYEEIIEFMSIVPTRIKQQPQKIGTVAANLLIKKMTEPKTKNETILVESILSEGTTTRKL